MLFRTVLRDGAADRFWSRFPFGRYHDSRSPGRTSYWCESVESAWREVLAHNQDADPEAFVVLVAELTAKDVLALTDAEARAAFGVTREDLLATRYEKTQELGLKIRERGFAVVLTYSYADQPDGRCLVVFEECLKRSKTKLLLKAVTPLRDLLPGTALDTAT